MAVNLYAYARAERVRKRTLNVEANIPLSILGQKEDSARLDMREMLEPFRLAARESLDYVGRRDSGVSVEVDCDIPIGAGLGSSAATAVAIIAATTRAYGERLEKGKICQIAFGPESYLHGSPSGVDHATSTYGGVIRFSKPDNVTRLRVERIPSLLICDTRIHRSTRGLVDAVVKRAKSELAFFQSHVDEASRISESAVKALKEGDDRELGVLMNMNHELLVQIGVSHPRLDSLVEVARKAGALGAKLTGAGGGGSMIALCKDDDDRSRVASAMRRRGGATYLVSVDSSGVTSKGTALK